MDRLSIALTLCALLALAVAQNFECPMDENNQCPSGNLPNPNSCTSYIRCEFCQTIEVPCESGTYDPYSESCVTGDDRWCAVNDTAFCATQYVLAEGPLDPLMLRKQLVNHGNDYHIGTGKYTAPTKGTYFFHLSAGVVPDLPVDCVIDGLGIPSGLYTDKPGHGYDIIGRSTIASLEANTLVSLKLAEGAAVQGSLNNRTAWSGFSIDDFMNTTVKCAFSASIDSWPTIVPPTTEADVTTDTDATTAAAAADMATTDTPEPPTNVIPFDEVLLDECGGGYSPADGTFTVTDTGFYFFTFSAGVETTTRSRVQFKRNNEPLTEVVDAGTNTEGTHIISASVLVSLLADEKITVNLEEGQLLNSPHSADTLISFSGFRYIPQGSPDTDPSIPYILNVQAWSLYATEDQVGPKRMEFGDVRVDTGQLYDTTAKLIQPSVSGYYFISFSIGVDAANHGDSVLVELQKISTGAPSVVVADINATQINGQNTISRSILLLVDDSEKLVLSVAEGHTVLSAGNQTSFSGFLVKRFAPPIPSPVVLEEQPVQHSTNKRRWHRTNQRKHAKP